MSLRDYLRRFIVVVFLCFGILPVILPVLGYIINILFHGSFQCQGTFFEYFKTTWALNLFYNSTYYTIITYAIYNPIVISLARSSKNSFSVYFKKIIYFSLLALFFLLDKGFEDVLTYCLYSRTRFLPLEVWLQIFLASAVIVILHYILIDRHFERKT